MVSPLCSCTPRVVVIVEPAGWVAGDVLADRRQVAVVADDLFVIVPLPDGSAGGMAQGVDAFGGGGFEPRDKRPR